MEVLNRLESKEGVELTEMVHPNSIKKIKDLIEYFKVESMKLDLLVIGGKPNQVYQECVNKVSLAETTDEFKEIEQQLIEFKKSLEKTINWDYSRVFPTALTAYKGWIDYRIEQIKEQDSLLIYTLYFKYKDLLEEVRNEINPPQQTAEPEAFQQQESDTSETLAVVKTPFVNNFDHVPKEKVCNYFKIELVDKNYLSIDDLHKYLIIAFQEKTIPAEKFTLKGSFTVGIIRNIFYRYYSEIAQDKHGLKNSYCQLLGEYFNGFDTAKLSRNFNK